MDREIKKQAYIAKHIPSTHEVGWLGHKKFKGRKDSVQIKFDPTDPDIKNKYIFHTHPSDEPSALSAMPSMADLDSAIDSAENGVMGIVTFSGPYYSITVPTNKASTTKIKRYREAIARGDIEDAIKEMEKMGFDIETGTN